MARTSFGFALAFCAALMGCTIQLPATIDSSGRTGSATPSGATSQPSMSSNPTPDVSKSVSPTPATTSSPTSSPTMNPTEIPTSIPVLPEISSASVIARRIVFYGAKDTVLQRYKLKIRSDALGRELLLESSLSNIEEAFSSMSVNFEGFRFSAKQVAQKIKFELSPPNGYLFATDFPNIPREIDLEIRGTVQNSPPSEEVRIWIPKGGFVAENFSSGVPYMDIPSMGVEDQILSFSEN